MAEQTSTIPKGWKKTTLGKVIYPVSNTFDFSKKDKVHFLNTGDILEGRLLHKNLVIVEALPGQAKKSFKKNDILYSEIRPANKRFMLVDFDSSNSVASTKLMVLRAKEEIVTEFIYKHITSKDLLKEFQAIAESRSGTFPQITFDSVSHFSLLLPPLPEQRAIAAVLSSLDDKIELLREQNKKLESTAKAIFKEWFVNFSFPGATGKTIDSELGKIPEGWKVIKLTELFDFVKGIEPGSNNYSAKKLSEDYLPFYRVKDTANYDEIPNIFVDQEILKGKIFKKDDILISLDGTIGRVFIGGSGGYSSGVRKVIGKEDFVSKFLIYCFLKSEKFQGELNSFAGAETTIKHAGGAIKHIKFVFEKSVCEKFGKVSDPLFQKLMSNISQIQTLSSLRDTFLPKLMSGEVLVKGFDK